jgi:hypothetical protein
VYIPTLLLSGLTHFLRIPKNIRSLLVSSGEFSAVCAAATAVSASLAVVDDGAVEAGESSKEPELVDAISLYNYAYTSRK